MVPDMIHTIRISDRMRDRGKRTIVWEDEEGTVVGDHSGMPWVRSVFEAETPVTLGGRVARDLRDPAHDPGEMLVLIHTIFWPKLAEPFRSTVGRHGA